MGSSVNGPLIGAFVRRFIGWIIARLIDSFIHSYDRPVLHSLLGPFVDDSLIGWFLDESLIWRYIILYATTLYSNIYHNIIFYILLRCNVLFCIVLRDIALASSVVDSFVDRVNGHFVRWAVYWPTLSLIYWFDNRQADSFSHTSIRPPSPSIAKWPIRWWFIDGLVYSLTIRMGHVANGGTGERMHVRMNESTCLHFNRQINERMGQSTAHLLKRPFDLPTNESSNEAGNERPYSTIQHNSIQRNII